MPKIEEQWNVGYTERDRENSEEIRAITMSWENRTPAQVMTYLNTFLAAVGLPLKVVATD